MVTSWNQPQCLVESTKDDGIRVNEQTLALLAQVREPVVVVGIAGTYRTGKSYLMNLLAGVHGFELGSTVQSMTKGIWAWVRPHPQKPNCCLLLLDTEGLADAEKGSAQHDTMIFALTVLLSSSLTYNSLNAIDQDAISKLHFVTEMAEHVKVRSGTQEEDGTQFARVFPAFIWAVRDFHLDTEMDGKSMSSDQYLERVLELRTGTSPKIVMYNLPRECIRTYFPSRKCFAFPRPVEGKENLKKLETLRPDLLEKDFVQVSREYIDYIFTTTPPKSVDGKVISGRMLGDLTSCYVTAMQNGAIPCIETAVETTAKLENVRAIKDAVGFYRAKMEELLKLPTEDMSTISTVHVCCEKEAIALFLQLAIFDKDQAFQEQMMFEVKNMYDTFCARNESESRRVCDDILTRLYQTMAAKLQAGHYAQPGGYAQYKADMDWIQAEYRDTPGKGTKAQETLAEFITSKEAEGQSVLAADEKLDAEQKRAEALRQRAEAAAQEAKAAEEEKVKTEQQMADLQTSYEENMRQLSAKMEEDKRSIMEENDRILNIKLAEQQKLLEQGFKEKSDNMRREIDDIRAEQRKAAEASKGGGFLDILGHVIQGAVEGIFGGFTKKMLSGATESAVKGAMFKK